jgi:glutathione peroxidase
MTPRQQILKFLYPLFRKVTGIGRSKTLFRENKENKSPSTPFYQLHAIFNNGSTVNFDQFKGKKVLLVNTASDCGYTGQYDELEKLYKQFQNKLVILGFPANDFKEQEKGTDEEIAQFCKANFAVSFPLMKKSSVIKGANQNPVYKWLTDSTMNGWNMKAPSWNFCKYIVDENGILRNYFGSSISPLDKDVQEAIHK